MGIPIFKIFTVFGVVSSWAEKALEDNKISIQETVDLAEKVSEILDVPLEVDFAPTRPERTTPIDNQMADLDAHGKPVELTRPLTSDEELADLETQEDTQGPTKRPGE